MADSIAVSELVTLCRLDAEIPDSITNANVTRWIKRGVKRLNAFVDSINPNWSTSNGTISLSAGTETYSLPSDFYRLQAIFHGTGSDTKQIRQVSITDRALYLNAQDGYGPVYYLRDDSNISFLPVNSTGTITVFYTPNYTDISDPSDTAGETINGRLGWEDYIIAYVGLCFARRMEESTTPWRREIATWERDYGPQIANMNLAEPRQAKNIEYEMDREYYLALWD